MSEDFKEKLKAYAEGNLSPEDKALMEKELEKLELYQEFLDEESGINYENQDEFQTNMRINEELIIKRSKWKARYYTVCITIIILNLLFFTLQGLTSKYYEIGNPNKYNLYRNAINATLQTTRPNADPHGSTLRKGIFLSREIGVQYSKQIGKEKIDEGTLSLKFGFGKPQVMINKSPSTQNLSNLYFNVYDYNSKDIQFYEDSNMWNTLEKLPEGTVTEAYITFSKLYETEEVFQIFKDKNMELLWLAADTGIKETNTILGFPHSDRFPNLRRNFYDPPPKGVEKYTNGEFRNQYFIDTLKFLKEQEKVTKAIDFEVNLDGALDYINQNGVKIFGVTVTGPTKEILKLREENLVGSIRIGESRLWNWD